MLGKIKWQKVRVADCGIGRPRNLKARPPAARTSLSWLAADRNPQFLSVCLIFRFGREVQFRQGLWIADLQTPPGQECSNGSMLCVAVVL
jgi:hypothetical protein